MESFWSEHGQMRSLSACNVIMGTAMQHSEHSLKDLMGHLDFVSTVTCSAWPAAQGVEVMTSRRYFRRHWADCAPVIELFESLAAAAAEDEAQEGGRAAEFQTHLSAGAVEDGLADGSLMRVRLTHWSRPERLSPPQSHRYRHLRACKRVVHPGVDPSKALLSQTAHEPAACSAGCYQTTIIKQPSMKT